MSESTVAERIKIIVDTVAGKTSVFLKDTGLTHQNLHDLTTGRSAGPSFPTTKKILTAYPQINPSWLLLGEGEMLKSANSNAQPQNISSYTATDEVLSPAGTTNARRVPLEQLDFRVLPHLPVSARAGLAESFADDVNKYPWENADSLAVFNVPDTSEYRDAMVVDVAGDSMETTLIDGSKVVVTPVQQGNWQYLNSGIYCVIYSGNFVIKRVKDNTLMEHGILRLHSDNPNAGSFPVKGEDIRAIWRVRYAAYVPIQ